jgi:hypothetical protein
MKDYIKEVFKFSVGSFIFISVINRFLFSIKRVKEIQSMSPSFNPKIGMENELYLMNSDYVVLWKLDYLIRLTKKRKDQLVFMNHPYEDKQIVRYLIGFPGDWIKNKNNQMFVRIPDGHCWIECVEGDDDSNTWGPVNIFISY